MKSQNRAWIMFVLVFLAWQTLPASPFAYFADMISQWFGLAARRSFLTAAWQAAIVYLLFALLLTGLLLAGRSKNRIYLAGLCSLATLLHHMVYCIRTGSIYAVSPAIAIGLALSLLFLLIRAKSPALWLTDAYVMALPAWLFRDAVLPPLLRLAGLDKGALAGFLALPEKPLIYNLADIGSLPVYMFSLVFLLLAILPLIFWAPGRQKG